MLRAAAWPAAIGDLPKRQAFNAKLHHADFEVVQSAVEQNVAALQFVTCEQKESVIASMQRGRQR